MNANAKATKVAQFELPKADQFGLLSPSAAGSPKATLATASIG